MSTIYMFVTHVYWKNTKNTEDEEADDTVFIVWLNLCVWVYFTHLNDFT